MSSNEVKICIVGPRGAGKSLICKLLADQPLFASPEYSPTEGVRIQKYETKVAGGKRVRVSLWDCSGDPSIRTQWRTLSQGLDGCLFVHDTENPAHEAELEAFYKGFAQPHRLTVKQCMLLGINASGGYSMTKGLTGQMKSLEQSAVDVDMRNPAAVTGQIKQTFDQLIERCVASKSRRAEDEIVEGQDGRAAEEVLED